MKILKYITYALILLLGIKFAQVLIVNTIFLGHYSAGGYDSADLSSLKIANIQEPYILHYNLGNIAYQSHDYGTAINEYNSALGLFPSDERVCDIRVNLALSSVAILDYELDSATDLENLKTSLSKTLEILRENNCANETNTGKSTEAETLEAEIEEYLKMLESDSSDGGSDDNNQDESKDDDNSSGDSDAREDQLNDRTNDANDQRYQDGELYDWFDNHSYYDGIRW